MERGQHRHRVAQRDDELGVGPQAQRRDEVLGRVEIGHRAIDPGVAARVALGVEAVEIFAFGDVAQRLGVQRAQVVLEEEMRLLDQRIADPRMLLEVGRKRGRAAARGADDEDEAGEVGDHARLGLRPQAVK